MENASKALIIAGAILIAILLISIGMLIVNSTSNLTSTISSNKDLLKARAYNAPLLSYMGQNVSGKLVKEFIETVIGINSHCSKETECIYINYYENKNDEHSSFEHKYTVSNLKQIFSKIDNNKTYIIEIATTCTDPLRNGGYKSNGYIGCISIKPQD